MKSLPPNEKNSGGTAEAAASPGEIGPNSHVPERVYSKTYLGYVLALFLLTSIVNLADRHLLAVSMPDLKREFAVTDTILGFIAGPAVTIPFLLLAIPLARLADRWSRRKVLAIAVTTWSLFNMFTGMAANVGQLAATRVAVGVGEAGGGPGIMSIIAEIFPRTFRSAALGIYASAVYIGVLVGLSGGAVAVQALGWRQAFVWLGIPGLVLALLCWTTLPRRGPSFVQSPEANLALIHVLKRCWEKRTLRFASLAAGTFTIFTLAIGTWMPSYFVRSHGMTMVEAGTWIGVLGVSGGVVGAMASGFIVDPLAKRNPRWQLRVPAIGLMLALPMYVGMLMWPGGMSLDIGTIKVPSVLLLTFPSAFLTALYPGPYFAALVSVVAPSMRSQTMATMSIVVNVIGSSLGPLLAGACSDYFERVAGVESLRYSLLAMTLIIPFSALLFWRASTHFSSERMS